MMFAMRCSIFESIGASTSDFMKMSMKDCKLYWYIPLI